MALSRTGKSWLQRPLAANISLADCTEIAKQMRLPLPMVRLLARRGMTDAQSIHTFLHPSLTTGLPSPFVMKGMKRAVAIIIDAVKQKRPIIVYGDYDADGITATALLYLFLQRIGARVTYSLPNRFSEGYGLHPGVLQKICTELNIVTDEKVLITVDCGIANVEEVSEARKLGWTTIITDHHTVPARLPAADAVLNPLQPGCPFPFKYLAGVGVAFYLVMGLRKSLFDLGWWHKEEVPNLKDYLDLVAVGSIADLVPLQDINRVLVKAGLEVMNSRQRIGFAKLYEKAARTMDPGAITAEDIAFKLSPRLNALGRIGRPDKAVELLTTDSLTAATELAGQLDRANDERKSIQQQLFKEAYGRARILMQQNPYTLVLSNRDWHTGVLGIVASQLCDMFHRPTVLLSEADGRMKGSGRAAAGLNLYEALSLCRGSLVQFGGHTSAAGLTLLPENLDDFRAQFEAVAADMLTAEDLIPRIEYDDQVDPQLLFSEPFLHHYVKMAPFGTGNPEPLFLCRNIQFTGARIVGNNHLKFKVVDNGTHRDGIGFGLGFVLAEINQLVNAGVFQLRFNQFQGRGGWEMNLIDIKTPPSAAIMDNI
jgi:single-stranded-DNA-specific exonuclease